MFLIEKIQNTKKIFYKIFLISSLVFSWISIGTDYNNLFIFSLNEEISLTKIINFLRIALNLSFFPILCLIFFISISKYKKNSINLYIAFLVPLFYFLSQVPGLFYTSNSLWNFLFILSAINILMVVNLIILNFEDDEIYLVIFVTFFLLSLVFLIAFINDMIVYFENGILFYGKINYLFNNSAIRSSGTSRIALILIITYSVFSIKFIKSEILRLIPLSILTSAIFLYQSRTSIGLLAIFIIFNYLFREKYKLINLFKYLTTYILIPILFCSSIFLVKQKEDEIIIDSRLRELYIEHEKCKIIKCDNSFLIKNQIEIVESKIRFLKHEQIKTSSGRFKDWKKILDNYDYNNNFLLGYGAQGDRFLINQTASNALLYALVSSGFIGFMFFLIFTFTSGIQLLKYLFFNKKSEIFSYWSFCIMFIIFTRSLVESSYALFSVDFILFYTAFILMKKYIHFK